MSNIFLLIFNKRSRNEVVIITNMKTGKEYYKLICSSGFLIYLTAPGKRVTGWRKAEKAELSDEPRGAGQGGETGSGVAM